MRAKELIRKSLEIAPTEAKVGALGIGTGPEAEITPTGAVTLTTAVIHCVSDIGATAPADTILLSFAEFEIPETAVEWRGACLLFACGSDFVTEARIAECFGQRIFLFQHCSAEITEIGTLREHIE